MIGGGSPRVPQPVDRRAVQPRPEQIRRAPEIPASSNVQYQTLPSGSSDHRIRRWMWPIAAIVAVITILLVGWLVWSNMRSQAGAEIDNSKHQAVFFASGQVYFGKLEIISDKYLKLSEVFYVQSGTSGQAASGDSPEIATDNNLQLIKLGDEVHGPEDAMVINRDQVLFFENLKPDGKVSKLIDQYGSRK